MCRVFSVKLDDYDCVNCFFKIIDNDCLTKMNPLLSLNSDRGFKLPVWQTDTPNEPSRRQYLLKVKNKFVPGDGICVKGGLYTIDIEFILYNMVVDGEPLKGYYAKIQHLKKNESLDNINRNI